uniref:uncharacterized protein n=1 Tax=Myxine glutinosa TaxID=7769 RepID=UPI00358E55B8
MSKWKRREEPWFARWWQESPGPETCWSTTCSCELEKDPCEEPGPWGTVSGRLQEQLLMRSGRNDSKTFPALSVSWEECGSGSLKSAVRRHAGDFDSDPDAQCGLSFPEVVDGNDDWNGESCCETWQGECGKSDGHGDDEESELDLEGTVNDKAFVAAEQAEEWRLMEDDGGGGEEGVRKEQDVEEMKVKEKDSCHLDLDLACPVLEQSLQQLMAEQTIEAWVCHDSEPQQTTWSFHEKERESEHPDDETRAAGQGDENVSDFTVLEAGSSLITAQTGSQLAYDSAETAGKSGLTPTYGETEDIKLSRALSCPPHLSQITNNCSQKSPRSFNDPCSDDLSNFADLISLSRRGNTDEEMHNSSVPDDNPSCPIFTHLAEVPHSLCKALASAGCCSSSLPSPYATKHIFRSLDLGDIPTDTGHANPPSSTTDLSFRSAHPRKIDPAHPLPFNAGSSDGSFTPSSLPGQCPFASYDHGSTIYALMQCSEALTASLATHGMTSAETDLDSKCRKQGSLEEESKESTDVRLSSSLISQWLRDLAGTVEAANTSLGTNDNGLPSHGCSCTAKIARDTETMHMTIGDLPGVKSSMVKANDDTSILRATQNSTNSDFRSCVDGLSTMICNQCSCSNDQKSRLTVCPGESLIHQGLHLLLSKEQASKHSSEDESFSDAGKVATDAGESWGRCCSLDEQFFLQMANGIVDRLRLKSAAGVEVLQVLLALLRHICEQCNAAGLHPEPPKDAMQDKVENQADNFSRHKERADKNQEDVSKPSICYCLNRTEICSSPSSMSSSSCSSLFSSGSALQAPTLPLHKHRSTIWMQKRAASHSSHVSSVPSVILDNNHQSKMHSSCGTTASGVFKANVTEETMPISPDPLFLSCNVCHNTDSSGSRRDLVTSPNDEDSSDEGFHSNPDKRIWGMPVKEVEGTGMKEAIEGLNDPTSKKIASQLSQDSLLIIENGGLEKNSDGMFLHTSEQDCKNEQLCSRCHSILALCYENIDTLPDQQGTIWRGRYQESMNKEQDCRKKTMDTKVSDEQLATQHSNISECSWEQGEEISESLTAGRLVSAQQQKEQWQKTEEWKKQKEDQVKQKEQQIEQQGVQIMTGFQQGHQLVHIPHHPGFLNDKVNDAFALDNCTLSSRGTEEVLKPISGEGKESNMEHRDNYRDAHDESGRDKHLGKVMENTEGRAEGMIEHHPYCSSISEEFECLTDFRACRHFEQMHALTNVLQIHAEKWAHVWIREAMTQAVGMIRMQNNGTGGENRREEIFKEWKMNIQEMGIIERVKEVGKVEKDAGADENEAYIDDEVVTQWGSNTEAKSDIIIRIHRSAERDEKWENRSGVGKREHDEEKSGIEVVASEVRSAGSERKPIQERGDEIKEKGINDFSLGDGKTGGDEKSEKVWRYMTGEKKMMLEFEENKMDMGEKNKHGNEEGKECKLGIGEERKNIWKEEDENMTRIEQDDSEINAGRCEIELRTTDGETLGSEEQITKGMKKIDLKEKGQYGDSNIEQPATRRKKRHKNRGRKRKHPHELLQNAVQNGTKCEEIQSEAEGKGYQGLVLLNLDPTFQPSDSQIHTVLHWVSSSKLALDPEIVFLSPEDIIKFSDVHKIAHNAEWCVGDLCRLLDSYLHARGNGFLGEQPGIFDWILRNHLQ